MRVPRLRFTIRGAMILIAVVPLLICAALQGMRWGLELREELRTRQGVVHHIIGMLESTTTRIESLERRIANSERQGSSDPRHATWIREVAGLRRSEGSLRRSLPKYERLAARFWEPFPDGGYERQYLDRKTLRYLDRYVDPRSAAIWSTGGAAVTLALTSLLLLALGLLSRRLSRPRPPTALHRSDAQR